MPVLSAYFADKNQVLNNFGLDFDISESRIASKWLQALKYNLAKSEVRDGGRFSNFNKSRSAEHISDEIYEIINLINDYDKNYIVFEKKNKILSTPDLNYLHRKFEDMIGFIDQLGPFYLNAPEKIKKAIESLNYKIHELEQVKSNNCRILVEFNYFQRHDFEDDDYNNFSLELAFGDLYLHYCQLGKQILDVFYDGDGHITDENMRPLKCYSGEFDICFNESPDAKKSGFSVQQLNDWLRERNYDVSNKKLSLGYIKVGKLNPSIFNHYSKSQIIEMISNRQHIQKIEIK